MDDQNIFQKIMAWYRWNFYYRVTRNREQLLLWFVSHLPRVIVYRSAIRMAADATTGAYGNQNVPELTFMDALQRWTTRSGGDHTNNKNRDNETYILHTEPVKSYDAALDLAEAIRLTVEYIGNDRLPAKEGWSWFDALNRYDPEMVRPFVEKPIHFHMPSPVTKDD